MTRQRFAVATVSLVSVAIGQALGGCQLLAGIEEASEREQDASLIVDSAPVTPSPDARACTSPRECEAPGSPCLRAVCTGGKCATEPVADGPLSDQTPGDCRRVECSDGRRIEVAATDDLPPEDGKECTEATCVGTSPEHRPKDVTVRCGDAGEGFCNGSGSCGPCKSGSHACFPGGVPALCTGAGSWNFGTACGSATICIDGECDDQPSCKALANCQGGTRSCCDRSAPRGGSFLMGRGTAGANDEYATGRAEEVPEHTVTLSPTSLEIFPVTVGRFRAFVNQYTGTPPSTGAGAHPHISGSGWVADFNVALPADQATLKTKLACPLATWTDTQGSIEEEQRPINCVNWFEAFAFCIWDGGRLPTEAEWEYAAAGGEKNNRYPWGGVPPTGTHLVGNCLYDTVAECKVTDIPRVGIFAAGKGEFGHFDLAGSVRVWTLDWYQEMFYTTVPDGCMDCANMVPAVNRAVRGRGSFAQADDLTRSATRASLNPNSREGQTGIRCAH